MCDIVQAAFSKYPPKGMSDSQDWEHDENAPQRKAFVAGCEFVLNEFLRSIANSHQENMQRLADRLNAQCFEVNTAMRETIEQLACCTREKFTAQNGLHCQKHQPGR